LPGTIKDAVSIHKEEALRRGLTLEIIESPQGTPPTVLGDRGKVKNIVANVVANAGTFALDAYVYIY
jgi:signal transduction histidine kinase